MRRRLRNAAFVPVLSGLLVLGGLQAIAQPATDGRVQTVFGPRVGVS